MLKVSDTLDEYRGVRPTKYLVRFNEFVGNGDDAAKAGREKYVIQPHYFGGKVYFKCGPITFEFLPYNNDCFEKWMGLTMLDQGGKSARSKKGVEITYVLASNIYLALEEQNKENVARVVNQMKKDVRVEIPDDTQFCIDELATKLSSHIGNDKVSAIVTDWKQKYNKIDDIGDGYSKVLEDKKKLSEINISLKSEIRHLEATVEEITSLNNLKVNELKKEIEALKQNQQEKDYNLEVNESAIEKLNLQLEEYRNTIIMLNSEAQVIDIGKISIDRGDTSALIDQLQSLKKMFNELNIPDDELLRRIGYVNKLQSTLDKYLDKLSDDDVQLETTKDKFTEIKARFIKRVAMGKVEGRLYDEFIKLLPAQEWPANVEVNGIKYSRSVYKSLSSQDLDIDELSDNMNGLLKACIEHKDINIFASVLKKWRLKSKPKRNILHDTKKSLSRMAGSQPDTVENEKEPIDDKTKKLLQIAFNTIEVKPSDSFLDIDEFELET